MLEQTTVIGSFSIIASIGTSSKSCASAKSVRLAPATKPWPNCFFVLRIFLGVQTNCFVSLFSSWAPGGLAHPRISQGYAQVGWLVAQEGEETEEEEQAKPSRANGEGRARAGAKL